jgi:hypothetical protein
MAKFTTRVELHSASLESDYEKLHSEMEKENFTRIIVSEDGKKYHMPTAEYNKEGNYTRDQVFESAKRAAEKVGKKFSVLVTESTGRTWHNLEAVGK